MTILAIAALFFVIGVVLMAVSSNGGPGVCNRVAWILWAVAAILWYVVTYGGSL